MLIIGGQPFPILFSDADSVLSPELWNPTTETFRTLAPMAIPRNYHSIALLLPDGRVLAGGGGLCGDGCATNHADVEIFNPPYLLNSNGLEATRPVITSAPAITNYGLSIRVVADDPNIASIVLMKTAVVTHSVNNSQRRVPLSFNSEMGGTYTAQIPTDPGILTPGNYMLFVINQEGTPSIFQLINIQSTNQIETPDIQPPNSSITLPAANSSILPLSFTLAGTASDTGGSGFDSVEIAIRRTGANSQWFNFNGGFSSTPVRQDAVLSNTTTTATNWDLPISLPPGTYRAQVLVFDGARNDSGWIRRDFAVE